MDEGQALQQVGRHIELLSDGIVNLAQNMNQRGMEVEFRKAPIASHATLGSSITLDMVEVSIEIHAKASYTAAHVGTGDRIMI